LPRAKGPSTRVFNIRLQKLIASSGMNLSAVARKASIPVTTLQPWTLNTLPTDYAAIKRLAGVLGVSFSYLLTGEDDAVLASNPKIEDVLLDGGDLFEGILEVRIKRLIPKRNYKE
jgi:transcriptional regulator with XRE-family HTH domain